MVTSSKKSEMESIVYFIIPSIIFLFGMTGNFLGLLVLKSRSLRKIGPIHMYRILFITDTIYLMSILKTNLQFYDFDLLLVSDFWCKTYTYMLNSIASIPPMILVYISIERFISIKYPNRSHLMRKKSNQIVYLLAVLIFNFVFYLPVLYLYELKPNSFTSSTSHSFIHERCTFAESGNVLFLMIFTNRIFLPSFLMLTATCLLIQTIFNSRNRIHANYSYRENSIFRKDVKFAFTSLTINVMFIILNLPFIIAYFLFNFSVIFTVLTLNLFLLSYAINFYLILISNYLFRKQFFLLFSNKSKNSFKFYYTNGGANRETFV